MSRGLESRSAGVRYSGAAVAVFVALMLRFAFGDWLGHQVPYITFFPAVIASSAFGGFGPGLLATGLSLLAASLFVSPPYFSLALASSAHYVAAALFMFIGAMISFSEDVVLRERRRSRLAEQAERNQRRIYQQTLAGIGDGVISCDGSMRVEFMNPVAESLTGWRHAEAKGRLVTDVFSIASESPRGGGSNPVEHVLREGAAVKLTSGTLLVSKEGRRFPIEDSASPIRDDSGGIIGAVLVFRDVSERTGAQHALEESERRAREILESITDSFLALDSEWRLTYVNGAAERTLGKSRGELIDRIIWDLYPHARDSKVGREYRRAIETQTAAQFEHFSEVMRRWFDMTAFPAAGGGLSVFFRDVTRRKEAEADLIAAKNEMERARDLLQTTLSSIGDAVIATDREQRITFLNEVAASLIGISRAEGAGRLLDDVFQIWAEGSESRLECPAAVVLRENVPAHLPGPTILRTATREVPIDDSAAPIRDAAGNVIGTVIVFRDVSDRRQARQELERSEERRRLAIEAGEIGVWDWDVAGNHIEWSDRLYELHGLSREDFDATLESYSKLVHPDDAAAVFSAIGQAVREEPYFTGEFRILRPDGQVRWVSTRAHVFRGEDGQAVRLLGASIDVTARRSAEIALRESEARLRLALDVGGMATWDWDMKTGAVVWSEGHFRLLGFNPGEVIPSYENWVAAVHPNDRERVLAGIDAAIRERREYRSEYRTVAGDGIIRWLEARGQFFFDHGGEPYRMVGIHVDVTERKRAEESLLRVNEELQHFAYAASHDLQEPLRTITSFSQLLVRDYPNATGDAQQYVSFIVEGTTRMRALIQGMLEFSRTGGAATFQLKPTPSREVVEGVLKTLRTAIDETQAEVEYGDLPLVMGDPPQLAQVFQNLISNSIKYRRPGKRPSIRISAERQDGFWRFAVRDNGIGFEPEHAERIFRPFKRLHGAEVPGAGIGLALCRRIVERHRGAIWAESDASGAAFFFTLPVVAPQAANARS